MLLREIHAVYTDLATQAHVSQADLELYYVKDHRELITPCPHVQSARITGVNHHTSLCRAGDWTQGSVQSRTHYQLSYNPAHGCDLWWALKWKGLPGNLSPLPFKRLFLKFLIYTYVSVCLSLCMCVHMSVGAPTLGALDPLKLELPAVVRHPTLGCWEVNSSPLQEQQAS